MAPRYRPDKCLYYVKGYCAQDYTSPKKCCNVCEGYVHYDMDPKHKPNFIRTFNEGGKNEQK